MSARSARRPGPASVTRRPALRLPRRGWSGAARGPASGAALPVPWPCLRSAGRRRRAPERPGHDFITLRASPRGRAHLLVAPVLVPGGKASLVPVVPDGVAEYEVDDLLLGHAN